MKTFEEYQAEATKVPASLRNNRDRISLPTTGLQQEAGKISALLSAASASGRIALTPEQRKKLRDQLADVLWYVALLCQEAGVPMEDVATHSLTEVQERFRNFDPNAR